MATITKGLKGEEISEMGELIKGGAVAFSDDGMPNRLPLTKTTDDDLDGWVIIHGHIHAKDTFFPEGNPNVICVDQCAGKAGGRIGAFIINDYVRKGTAITSDSTS